MVESKEPGLVPLAAVAVTPGWENINPGRREFPPQKVLWTADLSAARLDLRDGAKGEMKVTRGPDGKDVLEITKLNAAGTMVVTAPPFAVAPGAKLRVSAYCECRDGDPNEGEGYLRLYGRKEDLSEAPGCRTW